MIQINGEAGGTTLSGTLYEPDDEPPQFRGAPNEGSQYVWVCDEFYEVDSGGATQHIDGKQIQVAFESPVPRGFESRDKAIEAAKEHIRTQFARIGIPGEDVEIATAEDVDGSE